MTGPLSTIRLLRYTSQAAKILEDPNKASGLDALDDAIGLLRRALALVPAAHGAFGMDLALFHLGDALMRRFEQVGAPEDLDEAITSARQAVTLSPDGNPYRDRYLSTLAVALWRRYELSGAGADLDEAITAGRQAVGFTSDAETDIRPVVSSLASGLRSAFGGANLSQDLSNLGNAVRARFERTGLTTDLEEAITVARQAVALTPVGQPNLGMYMSNLAVALQKRFEHAAAATDLDEAVNLLRQAVTLTAAGHPGLGMYLSNLVNALRARFDASGTTTDIDEAIAIARQAVALTPAEHPSHAARVSNLRNVLRARFERTGPAADLEEAIDLLRQERTRTPTDHPDIGEHLDELADAILARLARVDDATELDELIDLQRQVVALTTTDHPDLGEHLHLVGLALLRRFDLRAAEDDMDEAILMFRQAATLTPTDNPDLGMYLSNLGDALQARFEYTGTAADLDEAITVARRALTLAPTSPDLGEYLSNLASGLHSRFEYAGTAADLDEAIDLHRRAVAHTPADDPDRAIYLADLAIAVQSRFEYTGTAADLDEAIDMLRRAVAQTPADDPQRGNYLGNLAGALTARFDQAGASTDLDEAITVGRQAATVSPANAANWSNLSIALLSRFERTGIAADLDEAIDLQRQAVARASAGGPDFGGYLGNLVVALRTRFEHTAVATDLDEAIGVGRLALACTPDDSPRVGMLLSDLGIALLSRFERTGIAADVDEAIDLLRQAVKVTTGQPNLAMYLGNLAGALVSRSDTAPDFDEAMAAYARGAAQQAARPIVRARCARSWAAMAADNGDWNRAREGVTVALNQLALLTDHKLGADDRRHHLAQMEGLGPLAAYTLVADLPARGDAADERAESAQRGTRDTRLRSAWEALEAGRGVLISQAFETRTDLTDLSRSYPELANEVAELRQRLNRPAHSASEWPTQAKPWAQLKHAADERRNDAASLSQLYERIRALPGFQRFAVAPTAEQMLAATSDGTAVAVLVTPFGCGALIMGRNMLDYLPLPDLSEDSAHAHVARFLPAVFGTDTATPADPAAVFQVLEWAWNTITGPILAYLGHAHPPEDSLPSWPRIWWIPTGVLALVPLHAAGYHRTPAQTRPPTVLDLVISSYLPTMRVLIEARKTRNPNPHALIVGVNKPAYADETDLAPLAFAEDEAEAVHKGLKIRDPLLLGCQATHQEVSQQIPTAGWAHFACHAAADNTDPARGYLALHDQRLEVRQLAQLTLADAHLVYLSACTTATTPEHLLDEPIHLASAFLVAGYQHAIGTLWTIHDPLARIIAERTYRQVINQQQTPSHALHHTVRQIRANPEASQRPDLWAAYIHFGP